MRALAIAALIWSLTAAARAAEAKADPNTPARAVAALVAHAPPRGWTVASYSNSGGADPVLRYEKLSDALIIRVFGAPGSAYASPRAFLSGPAASSLGAAPREKGKVASAAGKLKAYRRDYPMAASDPHGPAAPSLTSTEIFAVLPLKAPRFAVVSWRRETPAPDLQRTGEKAWAAFVKSVRPAAPAKPGKK